MTVITRIKDLDLTALQRLRAESLAEGFRFLERLCEDWTSGANRFDSSGEVLILAVADGEVIGICGLNRNPYVHDERTGRVRRLYVLPAYRHSGVGQALIEAVIAHARPHFNLLRARTELAGDFFTTLGFRQENSEIDSTHVLKLTKVAY
jgi:N-acetylglutamate synthase-like GNAT family acetyltransferase